MIERKKFLEFITLMPFPCVDIIVINGSNYLLVKRKNAPAKNLWWFPGGRLIKGELSEVATKRICQREIGLEVTPRRIVDVTETIFEDGPDEIPVHSVNIIYLVNSHSNLVVLDDDHSEFKWVQMGRIPEELDNRLKEVLFRVWGEN